MRAFATTVATRCDESSGIRRSGLRRDAMLQGRQSCAHVGNARPIDVAHDDSGTVLMLRDDYAPGIDEHRMAPGTPSAGMRSALRRGQDVALIFDCTRAKERLPMRRSGWNGEGRGHDDQSQVRERAIELRKANVVADGQRDAPAIGDEALRR